MSRRPGLGHQYISRVGEWHKKNSANYIPRGDFKVRYPRFYKDKQFNKEEKEILMKENQKLIEQSNANFAVLEEKLGYWEAIDLLREKANRKLKSIKQKAKNSRL